MTEIILIADSGGSKTDWCAVCGDERIFFETESCHPANWNEVFWQQLTVKLENQIDPRKTRIFFFGAGCLKDERRLEAEEAFLSMNFKEVTVRSDLHGAGYALFGKNCGVGIISGTGSVLFQWENETISKIVGGKGHLEGDEGSGFYFGKIVREKWLEKSLTVEQTKLIRPEIEAILCANDLNNEKSALAALSRHLSNHAEEFKGIHEQNILAFILTHFDGDFPEEVALLGGYGFVNQVLWQSLLAKKGIELKVVLNRPIVALVEQMESFVD